MEIKLIQRLIKKGCSNKGGGSNMTNLKLGNKWNTSENTIIVARSGSPEM